MNILDIVRHLRATLPSVSSDFSQNYEVSSVSVSGGLASVTTVSPHGLRVGELASIQSVAIKTPIAAVSKEGLIATIETSADHDLTENYPPSAEVELAGFTDDAWNGALVLRNAPNRRTFTTATTESVPVLNGNEVLLERYRLGGINGLQVVTNVGKNSFAFATEAQDGIYEATGGSVSGSPQVYAVPTPDRATDIYDELRDGVSSKAVAFVIPEGGATSKDRLTQSDAIAARIPGEDVRLQMIESFMVAVYLPVEKQLAGSAAIGRFTSSVLKAIVSSLYGLKIETPFACGGEYKVIFAGHELLDYDKATMVWGYSFQVPTDLTVDDAAIQFGSRAFRDLDIRAATGNQEMTVLDVDLDDEPLG